MTQLAGMLLRSLCLVVTVPPPPVATLRILITPAPGGVRSAIQYRLPATMSIPATGIEFQEPEVTAADVPELSNCPGAPFASAYTPTTKRVAVLLASRKTFIWFAGPLAPAAKMNASAMPDGLLSTDA